MQTLPMELPQCPTPDHGHMAIRPTQRQTPEQLWCGVWYDCERCSNSVLFSSRELMDHLARFAPSNA